jgi:hypothetical protein
MLIVEHDAEATIRIDFVDQPFDDEKLFLRHPQEASERFVAETLPSRPVSSS